MPKRDDDEDDPEEVEEKIFKAFGIKDDEEKSRVRQLAAARVLAHVKLNPKPKKQEKGGWWG